MVVCLVFSPMFMCVYDEGAFSIPGVRCRGVEEASVLYLPCSS